MKTPAVLLPFKGERHKSRLLPSLDSDRRRELAYLLLDHVLASIAGAGLQRHAYVVTSDQEAQYRAGSAGVSTIHEQGDEGVNGALRLGMGKLTETDSFMVVPSDLALLSPLDLKAALGMCRNSSVVIAPSTSFNGTNLLIFPRRFGGCLSYDDNSFWNHLRGAAKLGLRTSVLTRRGLVFDVDTPTDAAELVGLRINTPVVNFLRKSLGK